jgi:hypothetical protein
MFIILKKIDMPITLIAYFSSWFLSKLLAMDVLQPSWMHQLA